MAKSGQICIKTPTGMWCSSSPITDCGCSPDPAFRDPYDPVDPSTNLNDPGVLLGELKSAISAKGVTLDGRSAAILTTVRLMLLAGVSVTEGFVVIGMDGMAAHQAPPAKGF